MTSILQLKRLVLSHLKSNTVDSEVSSTQSQLHPAACQLTALRASRSSGGDCSGPFPRRTDADGTPRMATSPGGKRAELGRKKLSSQRTFSQSDAVMGKAHTGGGFLSHLLKIGNDTKWKN